MNSRNEHYQEILKLIKALTYSRDTWEVFYDFVEMAAICISNSVDVIRFDDREKQYLQTINKYTPEQQKLFPEMFAQLVLALEYELQTGGFTDVLGVLFHELGLHNKYKGYMNLKKIQTFSKQPRYEMHLHKKEFGFFLSHL